MPKRVGNIYQGVLEESNLREAFRHAIEGKEHSENPTIQYIVTHEDEVVNSLHGLLCEFSFVPSAPNEFMTMDGIKRKPRKIRAPILYPDHIIHWALIQKLVPIFMRGMYKYSCGSIPGRGTHYAKNYIEKRFHEPHARSKYKYCLQLDIHHFFQSIQPDLMVMELRRMIKDPHVLWLCECIIYSVDDGLPIGYYTSQWFSNVFLQRFDHYVKEVLKADLYIRYVDDLIICGSNKRKLWRIFEGIKKFLRDEMHLNIKPNYQLYQVAKRGIDFLGFRFYFDKTGIRKAILKHIAHSNRKCQRYATKHDLAAMISYYGYLDRTDTYVFANRNLIGSKKYYVNRYKRLVKANVESERELAKLEKAAAKPVEFTWEGARV